MNECYVERADDSVPLAGDPEAGPWREATPVRIGERPWGDSAETTDDYPIEATAQLLYDDDALYAQYRVADGHQQATTTRLNGEVWTDSCVELFANPAPDDQDGYVNLEANCVGQFLLGFGPGRDDRTLIEPALARSVRIETSVDGPRKEPDPATDESWWLAAALPFDALEAFTGLAVDPEPGTLWRGNLQCCREGAAPSFAVWSPIDAPAPDFHRPSAFGRLVFE